MTIRELWDALGQDMANQGSGSNKMYVRAEDRIYEVSGVEFERWQAMIDTDYVDGSSNKP